MSCVQSFDSLCRRIVCPTRHALNQKDLIQRKFRGKVYYEQLNIKNQNNQNISAIVFPKDFQNLPTIVYLHGNGGHKLQCLQIISEEYNLISFDFRACGKSEGQYITYGQDQVDDIKTVINEVKARYSISKLAIWGRSMGASLALMYASLAPDNIFAMILDCPFRKLKKVMVNMAKSTKNNIPNVLINIAMYFVEKKVQDIVQKNIFDSDYMMHLNLVTNIPIMFIYSSQDVVVKAQDVLELYNAYRGKKLLAAVDVKHNQDRPKKVIQKGTAFIVQQFSNKEAKQYGKKGLSLSTRLPNIEY